MPHAKLKRTQRLDPRAPLVFDIRTLGPASARLETRTAPAPAELGSGLVRVPEGSDLEIEVQLEEVSDGVLVTATVTAPLAGECARCLEEFTSSLRVSFQELFAAEPGGSGDDGYLLDGDLLDLEPALRDALVLELPLSPVCTEDCAGLCVKCGIRLADAGPDHHHPDDGGVWAALRDLFPAQADADQERTGEESTKADPVSDDRQENTSLAGTTDPAGSKER